MEKHHDTAFNSVALKQLKHQFLLLHLQYGIKHHWVFFPRHSLDIFWDASIVTFKIPIPSKTLISSPAVRWWSPDGQNRLQTHTRRHTVEAPVMAVTVQQLVSLPAALWEMALDGPIRIKLCVDTSIHMIITLWGNLSLCVCSLSVKPRGAPHTHTHTSFNGYLSRFQCDESHAASLITYQDKNKKEPLCH